MSNPCVNQGQQPPTTTRASTGYQPQLQPLEFYKTEEDIFHGAAAEYPDLPILELLTMEEDDWIMFFDDLEKPRGEKARAKAFKKCDELNQASAAVERHQKAVMDAKPSWLKEHRGLLKLDGEELKRRMQAKAQAKAQDDARGGKLQRLKEELEHLKQELEEKKENGEHEDIVLECKLQRLGEEIKNLLQALKERAEQIDTVGLWSQRQEG